MKSIKLSPQQWEVVNTLKKYPNDMVMFNGHITGGHGICFKSRTINALIEKGVIVDGRLSPNIWIE